MVFDLGYFVYMDSFDKEKDDNKNRSTNEIDFGREDKGNNLKKEEQKNNCP